MAQPSRCLFSCLFLVLALNHILTTEAKAKDKSSKPNGMKPGPVSKKLSARKVPDDKIKQLVDQLSPEIKEKICELSKDLCEDESPLVVQGYKKQIVDGNNYFAAVSQKDKYFHVRIYEQSWTETLEVVDVIGPKKKKDQIHYF